MNTKLFQIRLLKRVLKHEKRGVLDRDSRRKPDFRTCERKALSERDSCVCILEMRAEAMLKPCMRSRNKILPRSAQILIVTGKAFAMHVNACSSNYGPNHVLDTKRLSEHDSFSCEHSQFSRIEWDMTMLRQLRDLCSCYGVCVIFFFFFPAWRLRGRFTCTCERGIIAKVWFSSRFMRNGSRAIVIIQGAPIGILAIHLFLYWAWLYF